METKGEEEEEDQEKGTKSIRMKKANKSRSVKKKMRNKSEA